MSIEVISYRTWKLEIDPEVTSKLYQAVTASGTEECICGNCKYFQSIRDNMYPVEIRSLFLKLGIDINKEYEVCDLGDQITEYLYNGWFHFVGRILEGDDYTVQINSNTSTVNYKKITDAFEIGFTSKTDVSFFDKTKYSLVQVEFLARVPYPMD